MPFNIFKGRKMISIQFLIKIGKFIYNFSLGYQEKMINFKI
jgi:hypothetical protein